LSPVCLLVPPGRRTDGWVCEELHPALSGKSRLHRWKCFRPGDDAPGSCTPSWRSRVSRRTAQTRAPSGRRSNCTKIGEALARSCTGVSRLRDGCIAGNASKAEEGPSGDRTLWATRLQLGCRTTGVRTVNGSPRTRTPDPSRGPVRFRNGAGSLVRLTIQDLGGGGRTLLLVLMRDGPRCATPRLPAPGLAPGSSPYQGGALLLELRGRAEAHRSRRTAEVSHPMPRRAPRAFQARPVARPGHRPVRRLARERSGRWDSHPRCLRSRRSALAAGPRPVTDGGGLAPHSPRGALALAVRPGALVRFAIQTPRPGLAPGSIRLTAGRSTLELARKVFVIDRAPGIRTRSLLLPKQAPY
jgi:hypothetical protein